MPTFRAQVDENGAVVLPHELRDSLEITPGAEVEFFLTSDGQVHFHAITGTTAALGGLIVDRRRPPVSIREMDDAIREAASNRHERSKGASTARDDAAE